jgi:hypothetical protein
MSESPLFNTTADAIMFALRFSSQQYAETPMSKLMKRNGGRSSGKGLVGLDGAGQAGLILKKIDTLGALERACIIARYTDRVSQCPCCKQTTASDGYRAAITMLADWAARTIEHVTDVERMRFAIVQDFYERRRLVGKTAEGIGMPRQTAYDNRARIHDKLTMLDKKALGDIETALASIVGHAAA